VWWSDLCAVGHAPDRLNRMRQEPLDGGTRALARRFEAVTDRIPEHRALSDLETTLTFREVATAVTRIATRLLDPRVPPGPVLVVTDSEIHHAIGILASAVSGRTAAPVLSSTSPEALRSYASRARAHVVLGESVSGRAEDGLFRVDIGTIHDLIEPPAGLEEILSEPVESTVEWSNVVGLTGTSGSTGDPKLVERLCGLSWGRTLPPLDRLATHIHVATNFSSTGAFSNRLVSALLAGSAFTAFPLSRYPLSVLLRRLDSSGVTNLSATPSVIRRLHTAARGRRVLPRVDRVDSVGEPMHWTDIRLIREFCGSDVVVVNRYGSTEAGIVSARTVAPDEPILDGPLSVGSPVPGRTVWIADDTGDPSPNGHTGEIVIEGVFMTRGMPLEPLPDGTARYRSADRGRIDAAGELWFEGRADRMVKVAGVRVEPSAVERVLCSITGVTDAAVLPVPIGQDEWRLVAHVVVTTNGPSPARMRQEVGGRIAPIAVPVRFHLRSDPLPLLPSGKLDVQRLLSEGQG